MSVSYWLALDVALHAHSGQPRVLGFHVFGFHVANGELCERDALLDERILVRLHRRVT